MYPTRSDICPSRQRNRAEAPDVVAVLSAGPWHLLITHKGSRGKEGTGRLQS